MLARLMKSCSNYFIKIKSWENDLDLVNGFKVKIPNLQKGQYLGFYDDCNSLEVSQIEEILEDGTIKVNQENISFSTFTGFVFLSIPPKTFIELSKKIESYENENPISGTSSISVPNLSMTKTTEAQKGAFAVFGKEIQEFKKWSKPFKQILWEAPNA